jgi:NAD(P)-dependent dehydrogenase (short-subunit alcohol dehydrogenase family)
LNGKRPRSAIFCQADITSEEAVLQVIADAKKAFQRTPFPFSTSGPLVCLATKKKKLMDGRSMVHGSPPPRVSLPLPRPLSSELHGAINCAGVGSGQRTISSRGPHNLGLFKKVIEINLVGTFNVCRLVLPHHTSSSLFIHPCFQS